MPAYVLPLSLFHHDLTVTITAWKIVGWCGALCFTLRWIVQSIHRHRTASATVPAAFWWISLVGAGMLLSYFVFGKNDSVGILSNLFPMVIAVYNLHLDHRQRQAPRPPA
jgi:lipid-A-disaccharide synthase-like uncharacterized protein